MTLSNNILITGSAGFIGFSLSNYLLKNNYNVIGIDSINDYYDVELKKKRHSILNKKNNFICHEFDLCDEKKLDDVFKKYSPQVVIHLAAQAGVRHSLKYPKKYIESNILATFNILESIRKYPCKHLLMASTSSVYGANTNMPYIESDKTESQLSLYAATKKSNESMAHSYSHLFDIPITMFRFFTVYGPWGRPDMAYFSFTKAILNGDIIDVYNEGNLKRDFTYIEDLIHAIKLLIDKVPDVSSKKIKTDSMSEVAPFRIVNIGNSKPTNLMDFINAIESSLGIEANKNYIGMQPGDVLATWADSNLLFDLTGFKPNTQLEFGVSKFINWYKNYYKY
ncbi:MAG: NAD-dependent epimerase/dehydratase family protein [Flavobacteriaceae bacterium]